MKTPNPSLCRSTAKRLASAARQSACRSLQPKLLEKQVYGSSFEDPLLERRGALGEIPEWSFSGTNIP